MGGGVFFTADPHLGHARSIIYSKRKFASVEERDEVIIGQWVERITKADRVYVMGDFTFRDPGPYLDRLPGQLYLVAGNHDRGRTRKHPRWITSTDYKEIKIDGQPIVLSHYAFETWRNSHYGSWHLHGHSHGNLPHRGRRLDVGVDNHHTFAPFSYAEVAEIMAHRNFECVDHHKEKHEQPNP